MKDLFSVYLTTGDVVLDYTQAKEAFKHSFVDI